MPTVIAMPGGYWTYGASILTFAFPMLLFIAVAGALYVLYTKPHLVPGHRYQMQVRSAVAPPTGGASGAVGQPTVAAASLGEETGPGSGSAAPGEADAAPMEQ